jgi:hypothetical protein
MIVLCIGIKYYKICLPSDYCTGKDFFLPVLCIISFGRAVSHQCCETIRSRSIQQKRMLKCRGFYTQGLNSLLDDEKHCRRRSGALNRRITAGAGIGAIGYGHPELVLSRVSGGGKGDGVALTAPETVVFCVAPAGGEGRPGDVPPHVVIMASTASTVNSLLKFSCRALAAAMVT